MHCFFKLIDALLDWGKPEVWRDTFDTLQYWNSMFLPPYPGARRACCPVLRKALMRVFVGERVDAV